MTKALITLEKAQQMCATARIQSAREEREWIIDFIKRLKVAEQSATPTSTMEQAMQGYAVGEFDGILHVLENRNA